eukprot:1156551-Pelagomonas_calceolata.AAC.4
MQSGQSLTWKLKPDSTRIYQECWHVIITAMEPSEAALPRLRQQLQGFEVGCFGLHEAVTGLQWDLTFSQVVWLLGPLCQSHKSIHDFEKKSLCQPRSCVH